MIGQREIDRRHFLALALGAAANVCAGSVAADDHGDDGDDDHDKAYLYRDRGDFRPLPEILERLTGDLPEGHEILSMELERKGELWVYEFRVVDDLGRRYELCVDARTGDRLGAEGEDDACASGRGRSEDRQGRYPRPLGHRLYRGNHD